MQCYDLLKARIVDGTYGPGHRLVIDQLSRESGISAIPWREAMRMLEAEGWIEIIPNVGARVAAFDAGEWQNSMRLIATLEGHATALAAPELTADDLAAARRMNDDMIEALANFDPTRFMLLNKQFHVLICHRAPDPHLNQLLEAEWPRLDVIRRSQFTHAPGRAAESNSEHVALLDLIESHADAETIEYAARKHKLNTLNAVSRYRQLTAAV